MGLVSLAVLSFCDGIGRGVAMGRSFRSGVTAGGRGLTEAPEPLRTSRSFSGRGTGFIRFSVWSLGTRQGSTCFSRFRLSLTTTPVVFRLALYICFGDCVPILSPFCNEHWKSQYRYGPTG